MREEINEMRRAEEERVLGESPVKKFGSHELSSTIGTGTGTSPVPASPPFAVPAVGEASLADF